MSRNIKGNRQQPFREDKRIIEDPQRLLFFAEQVGSRCTFSSETRISRTPLSFFYASEASASVIYVVFYATYFHSGEAFLFGSKIYIL